MPQLKESISAAPAMHQRHAEQLVADAIEETLGYPIHDSVARNLLRAMRARGLLYGKVLPPHEMAKSVDAVQQMRDLGKLPGSKPKRLSGKVYTEGTYTDETRQLLRSTEPAKGRAFACDW